MIILRDGSMLTNQAQLTAAMAANPATVKTVIDRQHVKDGLDGFFADWNEATDGHMQSVPYVNMDLLFEDFRRLLA
jgi:hypothetical protein